MGDKIWLTLGLVKNSRAWRTLTQVNFARPFQIIYLKLNLQYYDTIIISKLRPT